MDPVRTARSRAKARKAEASKGREDARGGHRPGMLEAAMGRYVGSELEEAKGSVVFVLRDIRFCVNFFCGSFLS